MQDSDAQGSSSFLSLRQTYATAIIRLVNGLVDPLQLGAYARSIASIATQLGLPPWLVELRHAATHEDLPSIELLRQAGRDVSRIRAILSPQFHSHVNDIPGYDMVAQQLLVTNSEPICAEHRTRARPTLYRTSFQTVQIPIVSGHKRCFFTYAIPARDHQGDERSRKVDRGS